MLAEDSGHLASSFRADGSALARDVVAAALRRYLEARRRRVEPFVARHFSMRGALRLHRHALGWDIAKAPVNLIVAVPQIGLKLAAGAAAALGADRTAASLGARNLLLKTRVAEEIEWLLYTELLELPYRQGDRVATRDAVAEEILADPRVREPMNNMLAAIAAHGGDSGFRAQLEQAMTVYAGTRTAAADLATALLAAGIGATTVKQLTPGIMTLGPSLAAAVAQQAAIASFPLGAGLGSLWYSIFPAAASPALVVGMTGGLAVVAAALAAFAGIITDPVQRHLGLHQRRLHRMIDALKQQVTTSQGGAYVVRDHYVARLLDFLDLITSAYRLVRTS